MTHSAEIADAQARDVVRRHLRGGEELVWFGKPEPGWRLRPADAFLIPFGILWFAFAIFWEALAVVGALGTSDGFGWFFPLFGLPFLVVGWYVTIGRFWVRAAQRRRLLYAVTDRRVMAIGRGAVDTVRSVYLQGLPGVGQRVGRDGVGTLTFEPIPLMWAMYAGSGLEWMLGGLAALPLQFFDIPHASHVAALIDQHREAAD